MLSDHDIKKELADEGGLIIDPLDWDCIGPNSIDLHLSPLFHVFPPTWSEPVDPKHNNSHDGDPIEADHVIIEPGGFMLGSTIEHFVFPADLAGQLEGKSSLGRLGLLVHATAGFFDAGFIGNPTLELVNVRRRPIILYAGMPIAQMTINRLDSPADVMYGSRLTSKYANQGARPVPSQYHRNWDGLLDRWR